MNRWKPLCPHSQAVWVSVEREPAALLTASEAVALLVAQCAARAPVTPSDGRSGACWPRAAAAAGAQDLDEQGPHRPAGLWTKAMEKMGHIEHRHHMHTVATDKRRSGTTVATVRVA